MGSPALTLRPSWGWRVVAWALVLVGVVFGASGAAYLGTSVAGGVVMLAFGALMAVGMAGFASAVVAAGPHGITYRNLRTQRVGPDDIDSIDVRPRRGIAYPRTGIVITRRDGHSFRLTALDMPNSATYRARAEAQAVALAQASHIGSPSDTAES